ncbi:MAG: flippase [bacterium]
MKKIKQFLFVNSSEKQTVIKNTFWLFVSEVGMRVLKLFIFIYAARTLGVSEWGVFSYVLALIGIFATISDIGVNSILTREVAKKNEDGKQYISTSFFLKIILSLIACIAFSIFALFVKNTSEIKSLLPIAIIILLLDSIREFGFSINRAFEKMETEAFTKLIATIVLVISGFIFISRSHTALSFIDSYLVGSIFGATIMYFSLRSHFLEITKNFNKNYLFPILKEAWPIAIISGFGIIMSNIDTVFLGIFRGNTEIGIYSAAQKILPIVYIIPALLSTALLPIFSRLTKTDPSKINSLTSKTIKTTILISVPFVIGGIILGTPLITVLFGQQYIQSAPLFKIMILALVTGSIGNILSNVLFAQNQQKKIMHFIIIGAITNFVLCFSLIPFLGTYGAVFSVVISQTLINVLLIIDFKKNNSTKINLELKKTVIALLALTISIIFLQKFVNLYLTILLSSGVYLATLVALKEQIITDIYDILKN